MASMDITENGFQTPASKKTKALSSPSLPHASQPSMPSSSYKNRTLLIATGTDPKFNNQIRIMSELRQYHSSLRVFRIKQTENGWIFIRDTPKDFAILQSEPKMQRIFGKNVKVPLPKSYHSADATKGKVFVFKGVSNNLKLEDFKELLHFNKITHTEVERMKYKRSGKELPFITIKCDDTKQADALISGGLVRQKKGIIFKVEASLEQHPRSNSVSSARVSGTRHQIAPKRRKCVW